MPTEELEKFEEVKLETDSNISRVNEGVCPTCNEKMVKYVVNKNLFDRTLTFHIIKFRCISCKKEYLDLDEAQKYDLFLTFKKIGKEKTLELITQK